MYLSTFSLVELVLVLVLRLVELVLVLLLRLVGLVLVLKYIFTSRTCTRYKCAWLHVWLAPCMVGYMYVFP